MTTSLMLRYAIIWPDAATEQATPPTAVQSDALSEVLTHDHPLVDSSADLLEVLNSGTILTTAISRESWLWCPSLAQPDPQLLLPVFVGVLALSCVEIVSGARNALERARLLSLPPQTGRKATIQKLSSMILGGAQRALPVVFIAVAINAPTVRVTLEVPANTIDVSTGCLRVLDLILQHDTRAKPFLCWQGPGQSERPDGRS